MREDKTVYIDGRHRRLISREEVDAQLQKPLFSQIGCDRKLSLRERFMRLIDPKRLLDTGHKK